MRVEQRVTVTIPKVPGTITYIGESGFDSEFKDMSPELLFRDGVTNA